MNTTKRITIAAALSVGAILFFEKHTGIMVNGTTSPITALLTVGLDYLLRKLGLNESVQIQ